MRRKATTGGPDPAGDPTRPAERGASGYRRLGEWTPGSEVRRRGAPAAGSTDAGRAGRVATAAGVATVVAIGGATLAPLADAQPLRTGLPLTSALPATGTPSLAERAFEDAVADDDVPSLLELQPGDRDDRELNRLLALAQLIVGAIVDGRRPDATTGVGAGAALDGPLAEALAELRALAEALGDGSGIPATDESGPPAAGMADATEQAAEGSAEHVEDPLAEPAEAPAEQGDELAAVAARQAAAREAAERHGREVARQAGAGVGGGDAVPEPDSRAHHDRTDGPAASPQPTATPETPALSAASTPPANLPASDAPRGPASSAGPAAAEFLALLNSERAKVGHPALALDTGLEAAAAAQAADIAAAGSLCHQDLVLLLGRWQTVGENVGFGPSVDSINTALVSSPGHHANMVNPDVTHVGIGVVVTSDGRVRVSQVFGG